jgi:hypothetical protein
MWGVNTKLLAGEDMKRDRWFERTPVPFVVALGTLFLSIRYVGAWLFLVYKFGWDRVRREHLRILAMPKGHPWPVSNGDEIRSGFFIHYLITVVCWLAMTFGLMFFLSLIPTKRPD